MSNKPAGGSGHRVYLMRHAKSSWTDPGLPDFARPLNGRGRRDAPRIGKLIADEHGLPDLVLCSAALRAVETYEALSKGWGARPELSTSADFYLCDAGVWLEALKALPMSVRIAMVVGHMPAMHDVLSALVGADQAPDRFPTAALAVVECGGSWSELGSSACRLVSFQVPRDL